MAGLKAAVRRVGGATGVLVAVSAGCFAATEAAPGDAASVRLGAGADPAAVDELREEMGLDRPVVVRYVEWAADLVRGDLGTSYANGLPVSEMLGDRAFNSAVLGLVALAILIPAAVMLGTVAGLRDDRWISMICVGLVSIPEFVTGALLILIFAVQLGWFPAVSVPPPGESALARPEILVLPVATLLAVCLAQNLRLVRAGVARVSREDAAESARLNGIPEHRVILRYILPAALVPALPMFARYAAYLLGGTLIAETLFGYPGVASAMVQAAAGRDAPVVMAVATLLCALTVALNLIADLAVGLFDPVERAR